MYVFRTGARTKTKGACDSRTTKTTYGNSSIDSVGLRQKWTIDRFPHRAIVPIVYLVYFCKDLDLCCSKEDWAMEASRDCLICVHY